MAMCDKVVETDAVNSMCGHGCEHVAGSGGVAGRQLHEQMSTRACVCVCPGMGWWAGGVSTCGCVCFGLCVRTE